MLMINMFTLDKKQYNKIKQIQQAMSQGDNITMLKAQPKPIQVHHNLADLKAIIKQKEIIISQQTKKLSIKREEMKNLSKHVNSLIDKQMKKPTKQRPSFNINYSSTKLNTLRDQKNKILGQIQVIKQEIKSIQAEQPLSLVQEVMGSQARLEDLITQIGKIQQNKAFMTKEMQENKEIIDRLQSNSCLIQLQKKEGQFENLKKQRRNLEKDIKKMEAEQFQRNEFYLQMKMKCEKEIIEQEIQMDQQEFKSLIVDINKITQERNSFEKEAALRIKNHQKSIYQLQRSIKDKNYQIRQLQNNVLRASLQFKRMSSMVHLRGEYSSKKPAITQDAVKQKKQKQKIANPEQKKAKKHIVNKIYMIPKDDANCIYIGDWATDSKTLSDKQQLSLNNVQRVKAILFYLTNGKVIGIKSIYIDKNNVAVQGKGLYNSESQIQSTVQINLEQILQIEYSSKSQDLYIRFCFQNGSWKELGQRGNEIQKINLESYYVKCVEFQLNQANSFVQSLKLLLQEKQSQQKLGLSYVAERTSSQMSYSNFESSPVKKKVVIKGRSLKKIKEEPLIDHRLMLNKRK